MARRMTLSVVGRGPSCDTEGSVAESSFTATALSIEAIESEVMMISRFESDRLPDLDTEETAYGNI